MILAGTPGEAWWDVHRCAELNFGDGEGGVSGDSVVEGFQEWDGAIEIYGCISEGALVLIVRSGSCDVCPPKGPDLSIEGSLTAPAATALISLVVKPSKRSVTTFCKISCSGSGVAEALFTPFAFAAFEIASWILVGVEVGCTAW